MAHIIWIITFISDFSVYHSSVFKVLILSIHTHIDYTIWLLAQEWCGQFLGIEQSQKLLLLLLFQWKKWELRVRTSNRNEGTSSGDFKDKPIELRWYIQYGNQRKKRIPRRLPCFRFGSLSILWMGGNNVKCCTKQEALTDSFHSTFVCYFNIIFPLHILRVLVLSPVVRDRHKSCIPEL
jgi:hypothetical protein